MLSVNMDDVMQVVSNIQNYLIAFGVVVVVIAVMVALAQLGLDVAPLLAGAGVVGIAGPYDFVPLKGHMADVFGAGDPSATQPVRLARADAPPNTVSRPVSFSHCAV